MVPGPPPHREKQGARGTAPETREIRRMERSRRMWVCAGWETTLETHTDHVRVNFYGPLPFPKVEWYTIVTQTSGWVMLNTVEKILMHPLSCRLEMYTLMVVDNTIDAAPGSNGLELAMVMNDVLQHFLVFANIVFVAGCGRVAPPSSL
jgi:hypothetical protein